MGRQRERERERERDVNVLFHLWTHSLVASCVCPDRGQTPALVCLDDAVTEWATWPGQTLLSVLITMPL